MPDHAEHSDHTKHTKKQRKAANVTERDRPAGAAEMADLEAQETHMITKENKSKKRRNKARRGSAIYGGAPQDGQR